MNYIYLHGFASRPASRKATYFRERFAERGIELQTPALDGGNFEQLTVSGQLQVIDDCVSGQPTVLIGSSLGGYLAALYAARHPEVERIVLLAPALLSPSLGRGPRRGSLCRLAPGGQPEGFPLRRKSGG